MSHDDPSTPLRLKTLLVEDDPDVRARLEDLLETQTRLSVVAQAAGADEAMAALAKDSVDVVVVDLVLAQGNGFDIVRHCRALPSRPPQVVLLTNYCTADIRRKARMLGADHAFDKSLELDKLLELFARAD